MANTTKQYATYHNYLMPNPECYIFLHHVTNIMGKKGVLILLPSYADGVTDSNSAHYSTSPPLARSSPIYSYSGSGPRSLNVSFDLHRDMMWQLNYKNSNLPIGSVDGDDYVDVLAREIQAAVLPSYAVTEKMVNPPLVSLRLGNDIFIKGVVESASVSYGFPILENNKYATVKLQMNVTEVTPYSAEDAINMGSFRGMSTTLSNRNSWAPVINSNVNFGTTMV